MPAIGFKNKVLNGNDFLEAWPTRIVPFKYLCWSLKKQLIYQWPLLKGVFVNVGKSSRNPSKHICWICSLEGHISCLHQLNDIGISQKIIIAYYCLLNIWFSLLKKALISF